MSEFITDKDGHNVIFCDECKNALTKNYTWCPTCRYAPSSQDIFLKYKNPKTPVNYVNVDENGRQYYWCCNNCNNVLIENDSYCKPCDYYPRDVERHVWYKN